MQLTKSQQIARAKENDARLRKATYAAGDTFADRAYAEKPTVSPDGRNLIRQLPESTVAEAVDYHRFYGQRRALQIQGYKPPSAEGGVQPEQTIPNELSSQRMRLRERIINSDHRSLESINVNPPSKIPASPGQSGSSEVMRVQLSLSKSGEPTAEEIATAERFKRDMEKASAEFIAEHRGKVASIEIGKESMKLPDLRADIEKRDCRVRDKDEKSVEVQCRVE